MKIKKAILLIYLFSPLILFGQEKTIVGTIIDESLERIPYASIKYTDSTIIGRSDIDGQFEITIEEGANELTFWFVGMEPLTINFSGACDTLEIIMMNAWIYDFITLRKVDRLRKRRFTKLSEVRNLAITEGIFQKKLPCYSQEFVYYRNNKQK